MTPASQRVRQGVRALLAFSRPVDDALAARYLTPEQMALFKAMLRVEQQHSLNVLRAVLRQQADTPHDLAVAALLHDAGKARYPLAVWQKTLTVLVRALLPGQYGRLSRGDPRHPIARPFVVSACHAAWGAELLAATGASETAVWLVRQHADPLAAWADHPCVGLLARLKAADDAN